MKVINLKTGDTFYSAGGQDLLSAALAANVNIPYSCRSGVCGACRAQVIHGQYLKNGELTQSNQEAVLLCQTQACSDMEIIVESDCLPITRTFTMYSVEWRTKFIAVVKLKTLDGQPFDYRAGQYIAIKWGKHKRKLFSMATPSQNGLLELHIRRHPDGEFTEWLFKSANTGALLGIEGPFGDFQWQSWANQSVVMVATGTGFAPIKALLTEHLEHHNGAAVELIWGARSEDDIYDLAALKALADTYPYFHYTLVISDQETSEPSFRTGNLFEHLPSLDNVDIYACGAPEVIRLLKKSSCNGRFFSDPFESSAHVSASSPEFVMLELNQAGRCIGNLPLELGTTLLQGLNRVGISIQQVCGGNLACGSCEVKLYTSQGAAEPSVDEQELLECLPNASTHSRLACQLIITSSLHDSILEI